MKYGIISDLHLNHYGDKDKITLLHKFNSADVDHYLIAGDLCDGNILYDLFFNNFKKPFTYVKGNHDYYGLILDSDKGTIDNITFATLWTNFRNDNEFANYAYYRISDFNKIVRNHVSDPRILPIDLQNLYLEHFDFIKYNPAEIILTHFPPSVHSTHETYKGDLLNPYFINDISDTIIKGLGAKLWVHGHVHNKFRYNIGNTIIACNPLGYPMELYKNVEDYDVMEITL